MSETSEAQLSSRTVELRRILRGVSLLLFLGMLAMYISGVHLNKNTLVDRDNYVIGVDFLNSWMMGRAGLYEESPERNYDISAYNARIKQEWGRHYPVSQWSYPPSYMLFGVVFGWLPYMAAYAAFMLVSIGGFILALRHFVAGAWWNDFIAIFTSPAGYLAFISGQVTLLAVALQLTFFRILDRRPILAGILLGMLTLKPHLGILYPLFLIATRRTTVFFSAAITTLIMVGLTTCLWGTEIWKAYLQLGAPAQNEYVLKNIPNIVRVMMPTLYMDLRMAGLPYAPALLVQAMAACASAAFLFSSRFKACDAPTQMLLLAACSILSTPYLMAYDTLFLSAAIVLWLRTNTVTRAGFIWCLLGFWLPLIHIILGAFSIAGSALIPLGLIIWVSKNVRYQMMT